jgi:hypothetical protein
VALKESLKFSGVQALYQPILDRAMLQQELSKKLLAHCSTCQAFPILHISAHGCEDGIALTTNELISWKELAAFLEPLHKQTAGSFLLALSPCKGLTAVGIPLRSPNDPLFGVVGTPENVTWSDNVVGYTAFYHLLKKGQMIKQAIEGMKAASGHSEYQFVHGQTIVNVYDEMVRPSLFADALG